MTSAAASSAGACGRRVLIRRRDASSAETPRLWPKTRVYSGRLSRAGLPCPCAVLVRPPNERHGDFLPLTPIAIVTGSGGLIGSESVIHFAERGYTVVGLENDMRAQFFGAEASTRRMSEVLAERLPDSFIHEEIDIRDGEGVKRIFAKHAGSIEVIVHTAAQPSHDWAAKEPQTDFGVNANGTLNLLEAARAHASTPRSSSARPTRSTATRRTACRWRSTRSASSCRRTTSTTTASRPRCRSTARRTRCSASPRRPPTCSCRSTGATSTCRPCASAAAA